MTPRDFIAHFDTIAEAPNGIARLREFVLRLAVRGRLVPQIPEVEPVEHLLRQLKTGKKRLLEEGAIAKPRYPCGVRVVQDPFEIPATWTWLRLGDVGAIVGGGTPKSGERSFWADGDGVPWLTPADMRSQDSRYLSRGNRDITSEGLERSSAQLLPARSVLFSSRAPIGHVGIAANPLSTNQGFKSCVPYIADMSEYLYLFLKQAGPGINEQATGTTFKEVSGKEVALIPIPIPPLAEQHRIVAKADELMDLLDRLEETRRCRETMRTGSRDSALAALRAAGTADEIRAAWMRISARMNEFLVTPYDVIPLRDLVLQIAVQGYLVSQNPKDESAAILLERITEKRSILVKGKKISKPKTLLRITRNEILAEVPKGWEIVRFGDLFLEVFTGPFGTSLKKSEYIRNGTPVINPQNLKSGCIVPSPEMAVGSTTLERLAGFRVARNDLVVARRGEMGRCAVVGTMESGWLCGTGSMVLRPAEGIYPPFVAMFLRSPSTVDRLSGDSVGSTMRNLNQRIMLNLAFALPPTAEQQRIVAKVDELVDLLNRLEETKKHRGAAQRSYVDAALHYVAL